MRESRAERPQGAPSRPKGKAGTTGEPLLGAGPTPTGQRPGRSRPPAPQPSSRRTSPLPATARPAGLCGLRWPLPSIRPVTPAPPSPRALGGQKMPLGGGQVGDRRLGGQASGPEGDKGYLAAHSPPWGQACWNNWLDSSRGGGQGGWGGHRGPKGPPPNSDHPPSAAFQVGAGTDLKLGPPQSLGLVEDAGQASAGRCQQSPSPSPGSSPTALGAAAAAVRSCRTSLPKALSR